MLAHGVIPTTEAAEGKAEKISPKGNERAE